MLFHLCLREVLSVKLRAFDCLFLYDKLLQNLCREGFNVDMISDILGAMEYALGPADSHWGKLRAAMGHPAPFRLPVKVGVSVCDRSGGMETFGLFEDSLPDGWGRRLVDIAFRKQYGREPSGAPVRKPVFAIT